jgi:3-dehydrotetronate 4-kinase
MLRTGVIADDFTGATDIASGYVRRGHRAVVVTDTAAVADTDQDVVVVALKSRTAPVASAVADSLEALDALRDAGCERFVFKYCSTFDSTDRGNIGPVLDALADRLGADHVVVAPAFPDNGRTVDGGVLFVHGERLEDSPMRHHPLTPMTRSRVADILRPQTTSSVSEAHLDAVRGDLRAALAGADGRYVVTDAVTDDDLVAVVRATADDVLVSGAAGLALGAPLGDADPGDVLDGIDGARLVVCGSASARTREQIAHAVAAGLPTMQLDASRAATDPDGTVAAALDWIARQHERTGTRTVDTAAAPVVYTVGDLADVDSSVDPGALERVLARVVAGAVARLGVRTVIVAGGETSGAVVSGLGVDRLAIGPAIAPGVCWSRADTADGATIALALKSGNFGEPDMFTAAWEDAR